MPELPSEARTTIVDINTYFVNQRKKIAELFLREKIQALLDEASTPLNKVNSKKGVLEEKKAAYQKTEALHAEQEAIYNKNKEIYDNTKSMEEKRKAIAEIQMAKQAMERLKEENRELNDAIDQLNNEISDFITLWENEKEYILKNLKAQLSSIKDVDVILHETPTEDNLVSMTAKKKNQLDRLNDNNALFVNQSFCSPSVFKAFIKEKWEWENNPANGPFPTRKFFPIFSNKYATTDPGYLDQIKASLFAAGARKAIKSEIITSFEKRQQRIMILLTKEHQLAINNAYDEESEAQYAENMRVYSRLIEKMDDVLTALHKAKEDRFGRIDLSKIQVGTIPDDELAVEQRHKDLLKNTPSRTPQENNEEINNVRAVLAKNSLLSPQIQASHLLATIELMNLSELYPDMKKRLDQHKENLETALHNLHVANERKELDKPQGVLDFLRFRKRANYHEKNIERATAQLRTACHDMRGTFTAMFQRWPNNKTKEAWGGVEQSINHHAKPPVSRWEIFKKVWQAKHSFWSAVTAAYTKKVPDSPPAKKESIALENVTVSKQNDDELLANAQKAIKELMDDRDKDIPELLSLMSRVNDARALDSVPQEVNSMMERHLSELIEQYKMLTKQQRAQLYDVIEQSSLRESIKQSLIEDLKEKGFKKTISVEPPKVAPSVDKMKMMDMFAMKSLLANLETRLKENRDINISNTAVFINQLTQDSEVVNKIKKITEKDPNNVKLKELHDRALVILDQIHTKITAINELKARQHEIQADTRLNQLPEEKSMLSEEKEKEETKLTSRGRKP